MFLCVITKKIIQISNYRKTDTQIVVCSYNGKLYSNEHEESTTIYEKGDKSHKHDTEERSQTSTSTYYVTPFK